MRSGEDQGAERSAAAGTEGGPSLPAGVEPGTIINTGAPVRPRKAASVILLRGGGATLELLLVRRTPKARFMGGVWVFPGGAVDEDEGTGEDAYRAAAVRELHEEASIEIGNPSELVAFSRWITPAVVQIRFDTYFFLAVLPDGQEPRIDGEECVDVGWFSPAGALQASAAGELELVFPTIKHLEQLREFSSVQELLDYATGRDVLPVEPRVLVEGEVARIVLPGDPDY
ncbi:MAG TPA: NUDIX hydrolase [Solirubrobacteraceae bacterium]|nr:NUDIX hydrolase [Solirubrobacteraceae bacterium]